MVLVLALRDMTRDDPRGIVLRQFSIVFVNSTCFLGLQGVYIIFPKLSSKGGVFWTFAKSCMCDS
jgi:hypothetical protein